MHIESQCNDEALAQVWAEQHKWRWIPVCMSETVTDVFYTKMGIQETKFMFT